MAGFLAALQMAKSMQKGNDSATPMVGSEGAPETAAIAPPAWDWTKMMPGAVKPAAQNSALGGGTDWGRMK